MAEIAPNLGGRGKVVVRLMLHVGQVAVAEEREGERKKKETGAKHHFIGVLSPFEPEMNILICSVSSSKFKLTFSVR
jgi:hypothetical protein